MSKEDVLVKMNSILYEKIKEKVETEKVEYPSIKNFVEKACIQLLEMGKYNIEGVPQDIRRYTQPLNSLVKSTKTHIFCSLCNKVFFANKSDKSEVRTICPNCRMAMLNLAEKIKGATK